MDTVTVTKLLKQCRRHLLSMIIVGPPASGKTQFLCWAQTQSAYREFYQFGDEEIPKLYPFIAVIQKERMKDIQVIDKAIPCVIVVLGEGDFIGFYRSPHETK